MDEVVIRSRKIEMVAIEDVRPNNRNRNKHSEAQIERLAKIIKHQGFRQPLIVSNQSGLLVAGHGRLIAAKRLGMTEVPVVRQDFDSEEQEYQAQVSDNAIAAWAELDLAGINADLPELGPFDIELLGMKHFSVDISAVSLPDITDDDRPNIGQLAFIVSDRQREVINDAINNIIMNNELDLSENNNKNAAALFIMALEYMRND